MFLDFCFDNFYNKTFDIHLFFFVSGSERSFRWQPQRNRIKILSFSITQCDALKEGVILYRCQIYARRKKKIWGKNKNRRNIQRFIPKYW